MKKIILITFASIALAACDSGFEQTQNSSLSNDDLSCIESCSENNDSDINTGASLPTAPQVELDGKVSGGIWDGKELLKLDLENQALLVRVPVDFEAEIVAGTFPIPGKEGLTLEFVTNADSSKHLQLRIPLKKLLRRDLNLSEMGLPNGDPLPMVFDGKLPHISTQIGKSDVHFYTGKGTAALFVPTKFNPYITLVFPIKNKNKEVLGYFATIAEKLGSQGGFYASVQLPDDLLSKIDTWLPIAD
ncbi:MAG: hypothetical protein H6625_02460 [Bdellovibrionaceae bacterium]|nr:hypothetical protein [Pseudobdellovibrionaceae bacterium]